MFRTLIHLVINILSVYLLSQILPSFEVANLTAAFIFIIILSLVNFFVTPAIRLLTLPLNFLTFGLFNIVINLFAIWIASNVDGINVMGDFLEKAITLLIISTVLSIGHSLISKYITD